MSTTLKNFSIFNLVCVPLRIGIVLLVYYYAKSETSILTWLIGLSFLYRYLYPTDKGFFKSKIYWSRLFHAITYITCSIMLLVEETRDYAYIVLIVDIVLGFLTVWNHYQPALVKKLN